MKPLIIGDRTFTNRFFLGTGKFESREQTRAALEASGTELVTAALTRVHEGDAAEDSILGAIDRSKVEVMLNTSGARNAGEAVRIAKIALASGFKWLKIEIHPDARYLLPDPVETREARHGRSSLHQRRSRIGAALRGRGRGGGDAARLANRVQSRTPHTRHDRDNRGAKPCACRS